MTTMDPVKRPKGLTEAYIESTVDGVAIGVELHGWTRIPRDAFLAAVASELNVRLVPADAIVIERSELPAFKVMSDGRYRFDTGIDWTLDPDDATAAKAYEGALEHLALAEYLTANPPVDEAQRRALKAALATVGINDGKRLDDVVAELMAAGVRIEVTP